MTYQEKKEIVRELLERIDIVEVISEYVSLKKIGKDWYGLCPFHPDTKPSLRVREDKKVFNCFGCGVGGNVISFISRVKNISFQEAISYLAEKYYPVVIPDISKENWESARKIIQANAHILFLLRKFFNSKEGSPARDYLKRRKINEDMWGIFSLGFAPEDPFVIPSALLKEGFDPDTLCMTGSIRKADKSLVFIFRKKLIFPIVNSKGEVIAFGGRVLDENLSPKYINSAESPVFKKRESFFGILQAIDEMRLYGRCVIVEGYFDVIALHQAGVKYAISCLGTAITQSHIAFLKRICGDVIFMFDGDDAGKKAILKNLETFLKAGIIPKVCLLPHGEDPDSFLAKGGSISDLEVKDGIIYASESLILPAKEQKDSVQLARSILKVQELISIISHESQTQAEIYIKEVCERVGLSYSSFKADIKRLTKPSTLKRKVDINIPEYELEILRFALNKKESLKYIKDYIDYITSKEVKDVLNLLLSTSSSVELALLFADEQSKKLMIDILLEDKEYPEFGWEELLESILRRVAIEGIRRELSAISKSATDDPVKKQRYLLLLKKLSILEGVKSKSGRRTRKF